MLTTFLLLPLLIQDPPTRPVQDPEPKSAWQLLTDKYDADKDGKISRAEYSKDDKYFVRLDADQNGFIEASDMKKLGRPKGYRGKTEDEKDKVVIAEAGKMAPDFTLRVLEKAKPNPAKKTNKKVGLDDVVKPKTFQLSSMKGKKPVALVFGSYT
jgi:EF hand domain-containing protein